MSANKADQSTWREQQCPTRSALASFDRGTLPADHVEQLADHFAACSECRTLVADALSSEEFFSLLGMSQDDVQTEEAFFRAKEHLLALPLECSAPWLRELAAAAAAGDRQRRPFVTPARIDAYRLGPQLGRGAMGIVYQAEHINLKNQVALKILPPERTSSPQAVARFYREMEALGSLRHPNIVQALHAGESRGLHFLAMELVDGVDVGRLSATVGQMNVADACEIIRQAARGLQVAHQHHMVHRDIKPSNLMVSRRGRVKMLDLGLASMRARADGPEDDLPVGTADYMAPEQWGAARNIDVRADLYSLGCTLFKLLTGIAPFEQASHANSEKMRAHLSARPPSLCRLRPDIPQQVDRIVQQLLAKTPGNRYETPQQVESVLEPFCHGSRLAELVGKLLPETTAIDGEDAEEAKEAPSENPRPKSLARRRPIAAAGILAAFLVAVLYGLVTKFKDRGTVTLPAERTAPSTPRLSLRAGELHAVACLPNDQVVIGADDGSIYVRDVATGNDIKTLDGHEGAVWALDVDPAGRLVASGGKDGKVVLWNVEAAKQVWTRDENGGSVLCVKFSPDGGRLLTGGFDNVARLWDVETGQELGVLRGHGSWVRGTCFSSDARFAVTCGNDATAVIWDLDNTRMQGVLLGHSAPLSSVDLSGDDRFAVTGSWDGEIRIWDLSTQLAVRVLRGHTAPVRRVRFLDQGRRAVSASEDGTVHVWDIASATTLGVSERYPGAVHDVWARGQSLVSVGSEGELRLWNLAADALPATVSVAELGEALAQVSVGDARAAAPLNEWQASDQTVLAVAASTDGSQLATGGKDNRVRIWNAATGELLSAFDEHTADVLAVAISSDGRLASAARDGRICLRQLGDSSACHWLDGHQGWVTSARFSAAGETLLTGGFDGTVRVWDVATTSETFSLTGHILWINAVAFPPERSPTYALSAGQEGTVLSWNLDRRAQLGSFGEPFKWHIASCLDVSPDGKHIAVAGWAPSVRVFDAATHELMHELPIAVSPILSICFDSSGERLVAAAANGVIHVWNTETGAALDTFVAHRGAIRSLAAFEDVIVSTGDDGIVRQWSVR